MAEAVGQGVRYFHYVAERQGTIEAIEPVKRVFLFIRKQTIRVAGGSYTAWFPPENFPERAGLYVGRAFEAGEDVMRLRVVAGDHLFIDRFTYNFRRPRRSETIVFTSTGIEGLIQDTHYIKRLIAMEGEHVRIGDDRYVVIDGQRLDASTPGFNRVYSFHGPPRDSAYSGHVNDAVAAQHGRGGIARLFPDAQAEFVVGKGKYLAFGDNTMNSHDGRAWGDFPRTKVVGKAAFVFWPFSPRFGWAFD
jgi:signal peptidase I